MLSLLALAALAGLAASTPLSYHAITDESTGSVLIFPAAGRSVDLRDVAYDDLRGVPHAERSIPTPLDASNKQMWWQPAIQPVPTAYAAHPAPEHDQVEALYNPAPVAVPVTDYRQQANKLDKAAIEEKSARFGFFDRFHGHYYDRKDKYEDKEPTVHYDKYNNMLYNKHGYLNHPHSHTVPAPHHVHYPHHVPYYGHHHGHHHSHHGPYYGHRGEYYGNRGAYYGNNAEYYGDHDHVSYYGNRWGDNYPLNPYHSDRYEHGYGYGPYRG